MDKLDELVTSHVLDRVLAPERLETVLGSLAARRSERAIAVSDRIRELEATVADADQRLRRLYQMVEDGLAQLDDILKERIAALKNEREAASSALARACGGEPSGNPNSG
jgi:site-specific DNA recombinase